ncbi:chaperonin 10-like protein [Ilyonectria robusta]|uniref:chaperonin 10-like protein n=1 Tax=Ilyonectria robusta TaxID=1079257 RepID=UPI001E8CB08D|nr:chaperonin 10-like protein [Ilyonectria robusta]KAH8680241.1 chaperonin 10-like protein [Ilyonectria robusta]
MSANNLSCLLYGAGHARFEDRPIPEITDPHDILIRISYTGVCGSDVHFWKHGGVTRKVSEEEPLVMGHEASGIVHSVGREVTSLKPGDRVAIEPGFPCRRCKRCKAGKYNLCPAMRFAADPPRTHGTLARFFKIPDDFAYKIPDELSLEEAVLVEPLSVAVHGVRLADVRPGQSVLVLGSGTIGLLVAATAKAFGAGSIFIADINEKKLEFAKGFLDCATFVPALDASPEENAARFAKEKNLDDGVDVVLECTGVESSAQAGIYASAPGGVFVQIGMGKPDQTLPMGAMMQKETVVKASFRYAPGDYDIALGLLGSGKVSVKSLISSIVPFERATEAWDKTTNGEGIKNLIRGVQD